eukprot:8908939-Prorocentrum_lima.AAC.1
MLNYTPASRNSVVLNFTLVLKYTIVPADTLLLDYIFAVQGREGHRVAATFFCPIGLGGKGGKWLRGWWMQWQCQRVTHSCPITHSKDSDTNASNYSMVILLAKAGHVAEKQVRAAEPRFSLVPDDILDWITISYWITL